MQVSAEIRWFWPAEPIDLVRWFHNPEVHSCQPGGGKLREDAYLRDSSQAELGIKRRGLKRGVEIKGLVEVIPAALNAGPFVGPIELWAKWASETLGLSSHPTILTKKQRWLRKFDTTG